MVWFLSIPYFHPQGCGSQLSVVPEENKRHRICKMKFLDKAKKCKIMMKLSNEIRSIYLSIYLNANITWLQS